jgi:transposase
LGRNLIEIKNLHDYTIEELYTLREQQSSSYSNNLLLAVIMRHQGIHTDDIVKALGKCKATIVEYIHKWNTLGLDALVDGRGGSESHFTAEMLHDLEDTLMNKNPIKHGYISYTWTTKMLSDYINKKYNTNYSDEWIRIILKHNNFTYKRAQPRPTLANEDDQQAFKKNEEGYWYCRKFF